MFYQVNVTTSSFNFYNLLRDQISPFFLSGYSFSPTNSLAFKFYLDDNKDYLVVGTNYAIGTSANKISDQAVTIIDLPRFVPQHQGVNTKKCKRTTASTIVEGCANVYIRNLNDTHLMISTNEDQVIYTFKELGLN